MAAALALLAGTAAAQFSPEDPDWKEAAAPMPGPLRLDSLIPLEVPRSDLRFGVDAHSVSVGSDGVVRYVLVARSAGAVNATYEGIHCRAAEVKVFGHHDPSRGWVPAKEARWVPLHSGPHQRTSLQVARTGACVGHGVNGPAERIVKDLRAPTNSRFGLGP